MGKQFNKNRQFGEKEPSEQWHIHVTRDVGQEQAEWAKTDEGGGQYWRNGANQNPQASGGSQHGGSSSAHGDSSATAANAGTTFRMSQLSDRKEDGPAPAWEFNRPARLYMVVRFDLDTIRFVRTPHTS